MDHEWTAHPFKSRSGRAFIRIEKDSERIAELVEEALDENVMKEFRASSLSLLGDGWERKVVLCYDGRFVAQVPERASRSLLSAIKKAYSKPKTPAISLPDGSVIVGLRKRDRRVEERTVPIAASQVKKKDGTSGGRTQTQETPQSRTPRRKGKERHPSDGRTQPAKSAAARSSFLRGHMDPASGVSRPNRKRKAHRGGAPMRRKQKSRVRGYGRLYGPNSAWN